MTLVKNDLYTAVLRK